jgi:hypothetical protein
MSADPTQEIMKHIYELCEWQRKLQVQVEENEIRNAIPGIAKFIEKSIRSDYRSITPQGAMSTPKIVLPPAIYRGVIQAYRIFDQFFAELQESFSMDVIKPIIPN